MAEYDNTNRGVLFRETDKQGNEKRPDYTGKLNVGGLDYRLSGWIKEGKSGKFLSLSVDTKKPIADRREEAPTADADQDIPF